MFGTSCCLYPGGEAADLSGGMYYTCHICGDEGKPLGGWLDLKENGMDSSDLVVLDFPAGTHCLRFHGNVQLAQDDADERRKYEFHRTLESFDDMVSRLSA